MSLHTTTLNKYFKDLKKSSHKQQKIISEKIKNYVETESRNLTQELYSKLMADIFNRIFDVINSDNNKEVVGGIYLIDEFVNLKYCKYDGAILKKFASYLRWIIKPSNSDIDTLRLVASTLGHILKIGNNISAEIVDFEVKRATNMLENNSSEYKKHISVLILKKIAKYASPLLSVNVGGLLDYLWPLIRYNKRFVRESAVSCLKAFLRLLINQNTNQRSNWFSLVYNAIEDGYKMNTLESIHGSLLMIGILIEHSGEYLTNNFNKLCKQILSYKNHKEKLICRTVIITIPKLAYFFPNDFSELYLNKSVDFLIDTLKSNKYKDITFKSLGDTLVGINGNIEQDIVEIVHILVEELTSTPPKNTYLNGSLYCASKLAKAFGEKLLPHIDILLDSMLQNQFSQELVNALCEITNHLPSVLPKICCSLTTTITHILTSQLSYKIENINYTNMNKSYYFHLKRRTESLNYNRPMILLALDTITIFNINTNDIINFISTVIVPYLHSEYTSIRKQAVFSCSKMLLRAYSEHDLNSFQKVQSTAILQQLLCVAVSDPIVEIRRSVFNSLLVDFDIQLAQKSMIQSFLIALNDGDFSVREIVINIMGRLSIRNPALILPFLRKCLIQLLIDIEYSKIPVHREESTKLLGKLINASYLLTKPYVSPILNALLPKLSSKDSGVVTSALYAIGEISFVANNELEAYHDKLIPQILSIVKNKNSLVKKNIALHSLGQLFVSTSKVIDPYLKYQEILPVVLYSLKYSNIWEVRKEASYVLGILGAIDPYKIEALKEPNLDANNPKELIELHPTCIFHSKDKDYSYTTTSSKYHPTVAINALIKILEDQNLIDHHPLVVDSIMYILKHMEIYCVLFLPKIITLFLKILCNKYDSEYCENEKSKVSIKEQVFDAITKIVSIAKHHISEYLEDIFKIIHIYWKHAGENLLFLLLKLIQEISTTMNDDFKIFLPDLLPDMLFVIHSDQSAEKRPTMYILNAIKTFSSNLDDYLFLVIPELIGLLENLDNSEIIIECIMGTILRICQNLDVKIYSSRIIHSFLKIMNGPKKGLYLTALDTICNVLIVLENHQKRIYLTAIDKIIKRNKLSHQTFNYILDKYNKNETTSIKEFNQYKKKIKNINRKYLKELLIESDKLPKIKKLNVNQKKLKDVWNSNQRTINSKEDWADWMRCLSTELLKESPSPALRSCCGLSQKYPALANELFNSAFISCWRELDDVYRDDLVNSIEIALKAINIPSNVLNMLINLTEFMERDGMPLPINTNILGMSAQKSSSYAKALYYKEKKFKTSPLKVIENIIYLNNKLGANESAVGMLNFAKNVYQIEVRETWYEKLQEWEIALEEYELNQLYNPENLDLKIGRLRCLKELGEWDKVASISKRMWKKTNSIGIHSMIAPLAAIASWNLNDWGNLEKYVNFMKNDENTIYINLNQDSIYEKYFFSSVLAIYKNEFESASKYIEKTRVLLDSEITSISGASYNRAYNVIVKLQQIVELEEVIQFKKLGMLVLKDKDRIQIEKSRIQTIWTKRLAGCKQDVDTWQTLLSIRSLVLRPTENISAWVKFSSLCRKKKLLAKSYNVIRNLLGIKVNEKMDFDNITSNFPQINFEFAKHLWDTGKKEKSIKNLETLIKSIKDNDKQLTSKCYVKHGRWQHLMIGEKLNHELISNILDSYNLAIEFDPTSCKAHHAWAYLNYQLSVYYKKNESDEIAEKHLLPALNGFIKSVGLECSKSRPFILLQDALKILKILFDHGHKDQIYEALVEGFNMIDIDTWLDIIPQIIARIDLNNKKTKSLIESLLFKIGNSHPQALIYPLTVALKSDITARKEAATTCLNNIKEKNTELVEQASLVSQELIRVAVLWHELWYEAIEEASKYYYGNKSKKKIFEILFPLHTLIDSKQTSENEIAFYQEYGNDLHEAYELCRRYKTTNASFDFDQAWKIYCKVYRKINKDLSLQKTLKLKNVSPKLHVANNFKIVVPGTYHQSEKLIYIENFEETIEIINSKQRPRKLKIRGSDGNLYEYLLKGHEDLRQDERVMQLFGLINTIFSNDPETCKKDLDIKRYSAIPLSPNSGLIGWLPNCDTIHSLIKEYRAIKKIPLNLEQSLILKHTPDFEKLTITQKIEVFENVLAQTKGEDLSRILWLKSDNSEYWFDRRIIYTRSLAVMCIVGYILGLGDRHPSNIMIERHSGKLIHIDFGDCFEVAMKREMFPEKVPFRLTRMLILAMEVTGIEGHFRKICETVMRVLRSNKECLMAVLEAFVYDPLINWRLLKSEVSGDMDEIEQNVSIQNISPLKAHKKLSTNIVSSFMKTFDGNIYYFRDNKIDELNEKALKVIQRVSNKLIGKDFSDEKLNVREQVNKLLIEATSIENLCQCYIGWCPLW